MDVPALFHTFSWNKYASSRSLTAVSPLAFIHYQREIASIIFKRFPNNCSAAHGRKCTNHVDVHR